MFRQAVIHFPTDEKALAQITKEISAFRCAATVKFIKSLNLNDRQIETLYLSLAEDISSSQQITKQPKTIRPPDN